MSICTHKLESIKHRMSQEKGIYYVCEDCDREVSSDFFLMRAYEHIWKAAEARVRELEKALNRADILADMARRDGAKLGWNFGVAEDNTGYTSFVNNINNQIYDARRLTNQEKIIGH